MVSCRRRRSPARVFAQEVEGLRLAPAAPTPVPVGEPTELDEARLVWVQLQAEAREPLAQLGQKALGFRPMLEPDDEVIREAHDDHVAPRLLRPPSLGPGVEHIMKIEVRRERADTPTLHGPHLTACPLPILQHT